MATELQSHFCAMLSFIHLLPMAMLFPFLFCRVPACKYANSVQRYHFPTASQICAMLPSGEVAICSRR
eukprot:3176525-Amphidinium_carterae.1